MFSDWNVDPHLVKSAIALVVGILFCWFPSGLIVRAILRLIEDPENIAAPKDIDEARWKEAVAIPNLSGGSMLGFLERLIALIALAINAPLIIGAWLAFKVASKWEAWSNIIQVNPKLGEKDEVSYLAARRRWGSIMYMRFILGTISNLLLGMAAFGITWVILEVWTEA